MNKSLLRISFADDDADDHILFFQAVKRTFKSPVIDCFFNAKELLDFYIKKGNIIPHIIFLDKNMEGNTGYECLIKIKSTSLLSGIPVIIYSTSDNSIEIDDAISKGAASFITKPIGFNETARVLGRTIEEFVQAKFENHPEYYSLR